MLLIFKYFSTVIFQIFFNRSSKFFRLFICICIKKEKCELVFHQCPHLKKFLNINSLSEYKMKKPHNLKLLPYCIWSTSGAYPEGFGPPKTVFEPCSRYGSRFFFRGPDPPGYAPGANLQTNTAKNHRFVQSLLIIQHHWQKRSKVISHIFVITLNAHHIKYTSRLKM